MVLCNQYHMDPAVSFTDCFDMLQYVIEILHNFSELLIISIIALSVKEVTICDIFGGGEGHEFLKKA